MTVQTRKHNAHTISVVITSAHVNMALVRDYLQTNAFALLLGPHLSLKELLLTGTDTANAYLPERCR